MNLQPKSTDNTASMTCSRRHKIFLAALAFALVIPVDMLHGAYETFSIPIAMALVPVALLSMLKSRSFEALLILAACFCGGLSILVVSPFVSNPSLRPFASLVFLFLPILLYFLAREKVKTKQEIVFFLRCVLYASIVLVISLILSIWILGDGNVRTEGTLNGNFFLLPLSGTYGVHTLITSYLLISITVIYYALSGAASYVEIAMASGVAAFFTYVSFYALSREAVLAISLIAIGSLFRMVRFVKASAILILLGLVIYLNLNSLMSQSSVWATKLYFTMNAENLNQLSSGRVDLQKIAIAQLARSPLTGTGFYGYDFDRSLTDSDQDMSGWSTHVYYLTVIWKMGAIGAVLFLTALAIMVIRSLQFSRRHFPNSAKFYFIALLGFLFVTNMLWDALLAPGVMGLFAFLLGAMSEKPHKVPIHHGGISTARALV